MKTLAHILLVLFSSSIALADREISWKEDTAARRGVPIALVDVTDGVTPETGVTLTIPSAECQISKAGAAVAQCAGAWVETGLGNYHYRLTQGEADTIGEVIVTINDAAAKVASVTAQVIEDASGEAQSCTTTSIVLQSDASATDDMYENSSIYFLEGNLKSFTTACTTYTGSSKTCTVSTMPATCSSGDRYIIYPAVSGGAGSDPWSEATSSYTTSGTFGYLIKQLFERRE